MKALNVMELVAITGAASGEYARKASPKGSQSQAKGQKSNGCLFVILMDSRDWMIPVSFSIVTSFGCFVARLIECGKARRKSEDRKQLNTLLYSDLFLKLISFL